MALAHDDIQARQHAVARQGLDLEETRRGQDRRERIVQLVGDAGDQRAKGPQLVGLDELMLRPLQLLHLGLELRMQARLLQRERGQVGDTVERAAFFVAEAAGRTIIGGEDPDRLFAHTERRSDAGPNVFPHQGRRQREVPLAGQILHRCWRLVQERVTRERIGGRCDVDGADGVRPPAESGLQTKAGDARIEDEEPYAVGAEQLPRELQRIPANCFLAGRLEQSLGEVVEGLVVVRFHGELIEGASVLEGG